MINGVSFGAISTDPTIKLDDTLINKPHGNAPQEAAPQAATTVSGDKFEKKGKHKGAKVAAGIAGVLIVAAGALAYGVKHPDKIPSAVKEFMNKEALLPLKTTLKTAGETINKYAAQALEGIKKILPKAKEAVE